MGAAPRGGLDLALVRRLLWRVAVCVVAVGGVSGLAMLIAHPAGSVHRLADLMFQTGLLGGFVTVLCMMIVIGEARRQAADAARERLYQRLAGGRSADNDE